MTTADYEAIVSAYFDCRSLRETARRTGRSFRLVRRIFEEGDGGRPSIRSLLAEAEADERARLARQLAEERKFLRGAYRGLLAKLGEPLRQLELDLGSTADPRHFREVVGMLKDLATLGGLLHGEPEHTLGVAYAPAPPSGLDPEGVAQVALDFQRRFPLAFAPEYRSKTIGAIAAVQARRADLAQEAADGEDGGAEPPEVL